MLIGPLAGFLDPGLKPPTTRNKGARVHERMISVVGCHAEGEVGDVIVGGVLPPAGATMFEKKLTMERDHDEIRQLLIREPRGSTVSGRPRRTGSRSSIPTTRTSVT